MIDLRDIGRSLLTLEVNTIISDGIVAEPMPTDGRALIRIAQIFKGFIDESVAELAAEDPAASIDLPRIRAADGGETAFADWDVASGGMRTFATLRAAAHACRRARGMVPHPHGMRAEHDAILARIGAAASDIQATLRRLHLADTPITAATVDLAEEEGIAWPAFDHETLLALRRIWEAGVDVVVMQTVVRLDGGVTTRILDGWDDARAQPLRDAHEQSVAIALDRWTLMVDIARAIAGFFLGKPPQADSVSGHAGGTLAKGRGRVAVAEPGPITRRGDAVD